MLAPFASLLGYHARAFRSYSHLRELLVGLTRSLTAAIDAKDSYTFGHSERVARIAVELGRELGLREDELSDIYLAGLLHDIGKIGIRDEVLGKRTAAQRRGVRAHQGARQDRLPHPVRAQRDPPPPAGRPLPPRALRRQRLPRGSEGQRHPVPRPDPGGGRQLRCHEHLAPLPCRTALRAGRADPRRGRQHAVGEGRRRCLRSVQGAGITPSASVASASRCVEHSTTPFGRELGGKHSRAWSASSLTEQARGDVPGGSHHKSAAGASRRGGQRCRHPVH